MNFAGLYDLPASAITRESFFNIGGPHGFWRWGIYLFVISVSVYLILYSYQQSTRVEQREKRTPFRLSGEKSMGTY